MCFISNLAIAATWLTTMQTGGGCAEDGCNHVIIDDATLAFWYEGVPLSFANPRNDEQKDTYKGE